MRKLTKREIGLLYALACLVAILLGWMVLAKPALERSSKARADAAEVRAELTTLKINQAGLSDLTVQSENLITRMLELVNEFDTNRDNEVVDKQITTLAQKYFLLPLDLTISERTRVGIVTQQERIKLFNEDKELPKTKDGKPDGTQCDIVYVTLKAVGTQTNAAALAQEVSTYKAMRINSMKVNNVDSTIEIEFAMYIIPAEDK